MYGWFSCRIDLGDKKFIGPIKNFCKVTKEGLRPCVSMRLKNYNEAGLRPCLANGVERFPYFYRMMSIIINNIDFLMLIFIEGFETTSNAFKLRQTLFYGR